ncbi:hypothetical protein [Prosthecobacter fusiformis]|uniref:hypothetical protein n=1 Tax=Prosthecobacter fusiformis TaxID=48464 RepID=UPI00105CA309|nr:hypothetical protein [Prosthecobacter fusiformis]
MGQSLGGLLGVHSLRHPGKENCGGVEATDGNEAIGRTHKTNEKKKVSPKRGTTKSAENGAGMHPMPEPGYQPHGFQDHDIHCPLFAKTRKSLGRDRQLVNKDLG